MAQNQAQVALQIRALTVGVQQATQQIGALRNAIIQTQNTNQNTGASFEKLAGSVFAGNTAFFALRKALQEITSLMKGVVGGFVEAAKAAGEQEEATARMNAALRASGQYSLQYSNSLLDLSDKLQKTTRYSDDAVQGIFKVLATFRVAPKDIEKVTGGILDLASGLGTDLPNAAKVVGAAIQGNTAQFERMTKIHVEGATAAERLDSVLKAIAATQGGQAAASAETFNGAIAKLTNAYGEYQEQLGNVIAQHPVVLQGVKALTDIFFEQADGVSEYRKALEDVVTNGIQFLVNSLPAVVNFFGSVVEAVFEGIVAFARFRLAVTQAVDGLANLPGIKNIFPDLASRAAMTTEYAEQQLEKWEKMAGAVSGTRAAAVKYAEDLRDKINPYLEKGRQQLELQRDVANQLTVLNTTPQQSSAEPSSNAQTQALETLRANYIAAKAAGVQFTQQQQEQINTYLNLAEATNTAASSQVNFKQTGKAASDETANAIKSAQEKLAILQAEIPIRQAALESGEAYIDTQAKIAASEVLVKTGRKDLAAKTFEMTKQTLTLTEETKKLEEAQKKNTERSEQIKALTAREDAYKKLGVAGADWHEVLNAMIKAEAEAKNENGELAVTLANLTEEEKKHSAQMQAAITAQREELPLIQEKIAILEQEAAGFLSVAEAKRQLAIVDEKQKVGDPQLAAQIVDTQKKLDDLQKKFKETTINIGDEVSKIFDGIVDGILSGTNKGLGIMDAFKAGGKAIFADMLKGMLKDKLGFDLEFKANFLRDLPSIVSGGAQLIGGIWGGLMNLMGGSGGGGGSGWGSFLGSLGTIAGGVFGGSAGSAGSLIGTVGQVASASANPAGNVGTLVSVAQKLYSAFSAWSSGGSFSSVLDAGFGGLLSPLLNGITSIAPGLASSLGIGSGGIGSAIGTALAETGISFGPSVALGGSTLEAGMSAAQIGNLAVNAGTGVSTLATTISAIAPYLAIIGGVIATNTGVANLLNSDVYNRAFTLKDRRRTADAGPIDNFIQNAIAQATTLGIVQSGKSQLEAAQKTFRGEGSAGDIVQTILQVFTNLPQLIVAAFAASLPTGGTATRASFEDFIEDARKHQSRAFNPFFGSVPALDPATNQFVVASGQYDRNLGQGKVRDRLREKYGSDKDTPDGAFVDTMRDLIYEEGKLLGLTDENTKAAIGLSVAFKSVQLGDKGGNDIQRFLANALELVANLREAGASAALSMQFIRFEVARLGDPSKVFNEINDQFKEGHLDAQTYREAIEGLAKVYYKLDSEGELKVDLSDKSNKGLAVAQDTLNAIKDIIKSVPVGVKVAQIAVDLLNKSLTDTGEQGVITFEELDKHIQAAVASAQALNPEVLKIFQTVAAGASQAIATGTTNQLIDGAVNTFLLTVKDQISAAVADGITKGFIDASLNTGLLGPLNLTIGQAFDTFNASAKTPADLQTLVNTIQTAGVDAINSLKQMAPALNAMSDIAVGVGKAIDDAFGSTEVVDTALGLATAIAKLEEAQRGFNLSIDARIAELTKNTSLANSILDSQISDKQTEYDAMKKEFFPTLADLVASMQEDAKNNRGTRTTDSQGRTVFTSDQAPESGNTFRIRRQLAGIDGPTFEEKLAALGALRQNVEDQLALRLQKINNVLNATVDAANKEIESLNRQKEAIQNATQDQIDAIQAEIDAKQDLIDKRQEEIDAIKDQIDAMQKWKDVADELKQTIYDLKTGDDSAYGPLGRLSIAQNEFNRQRAIFENTSLSDEKRTDAAKRLSELGPQLLSLLQGAGQAQGGEQYRSSFSDILGILEKARTEAGEKSKGIEELTEEMNQKQDEIKDLQKEIKDLNKEMKEIQKAAEADLKGIDAQIRNQQDIIRNAQEQAERDADAARAIAVDELNWIRDEGNKIFKEKQDELKGKLEDLTGETVDLSSIQYDSWAELFRIRQILEGNGNPVNDNRGKFGLTAEGAKDLQAQLARLPAYGETAGKLRNIKSMGFEKAETDGYQRELTQMIRELFPRAKRFQDLDAIINALIEKIEDPAKYQSLLGFAKGGIVRGPTVARVGEGNRPELILPLSAAARTPEVQRLIREISTPTMNELRDLRGQLRRNGLQNLLGVLAAKAAPTTTRDNIRTKFTREAAEQKIVIENVNINSQADMTIDADFDLGDINTAKKLAPLIAQLVKDALNNVIVEGKIANIARSAVKK